MTEADLWVSFVEVLPLLGQVLAAMTVLTVAVQWLAAVAAPAAGDL